MRPVSFADRVRYRFDTEVSRGPSVLVLWVLVGALGIVLVLGVLVVALNLSPAQDGKAPSTVQQLWTAFLHFVDNGNISGDTLAGGWRYVLVMLTITIVGIFFSGALTGIITNGLAARLDVMRKGRSLVVERDHTVILGWSSQTIPILEELVLASSDGEAICVVILAERDKVEMEDEIHAKLPRLHRTRVVCRNGSPLDLTDLALVSPQTSSSIIVLSTDDDAPDVGVISTVLAVTNHPHRRPEPYKIVAAIHDPHNLEAARLASKGEAEFVLAGQLIAKITAQTCRQSGLSLVYSELLSFAGNEVYRASVPQAIGKTYGDALQLLERACVIGLIAPDGAAQLNPPSSLVLQAGTQLVCIAENESALRQASSSANVDSSAIALPERAAPAPEATLILGWNRRATTVINELLAYVAPNSTFTVVADLDAPPELTRDCSSTPHLSFTRGDPTSRQTLVNLHVERFNHVIVLASDRVDARRADADTLVTLLHLRELKASLNGAFTVVSEMRVHRNRELAEVTQADDFIVSERLVSLVVAQISQDAARAPVLQTLFSSTGGEIYLRPIGEYVRLGVEVNFQTLTEAARLRGESAIGYRRSSLERDAGAGHGVKLNPSKREVVSFEAGDKLIVVAD
jgi:voltage-gated potassium channel Kch